MVGVRTSDFAAWDEEEQQELLERANKASCQRYLACLSFFKSDDYRYGEFKIKFANDNIAGTTLYVNYLEDILLMLKTYKQIGSRGIRKRNNNAAAPNKSGMSFTQVGGNVRYVDKTNPHC